MIIKGTPTTTLMVAGCVIERDGKYLLVQEKKAHVSGLWNLPAGKVDDGYTIEETAIKEAKEETGFDVQIIRKIGIFQQTAQELVKHIFECEIIGGEQKVPEEEILDARWFTVDEIREMKDKLRNDWVLEAIEMQEAQ